MKLPSLFVVISKLLISALSMIWSALLISSLGEENSGLFFSSVALVMILGSISRLGFDSDIVKRYSLKKHLIQKQEPYYLLAVFVLSLLLFSLAFLVSYAYDLKFIHRDILYAIIPIALITVISFFRQAEGKYVLSVWLSSGFYWVVSIILMYTLSFVLILDIDYVTHFFVGSLFFVLLFFIFLNRSVLAIELRKVWQCDAINNLHSSIKLFGANVSNMLFMWLPTLIIGGMGDLSGATYYSVAQKVSFMISFVFSAINVLLLRELSIDYVKNFINFERKIVVTTIANILLATPIFLLILIFGADILKLFSIESDRALIFLYILSISQFLNVFGGANGLIMTAVGEYKIVFLANLLSLVGLLLCMFIASIYGSSTMIAASVLVMVFLLNFFMSYMVYEKTKVFILDLKCFNREFFKAVK